MTRPTDAEQSVWQWVADTLGMSHEHGEELARRLVGLRTVRESRKVADVAPWPEGVEKWLAWVDLHPNHPFRTMDQATAAYLRSLPERFAQSQANYDAMRQQRDNEIRGRERIAQAEREQWERAEAAEKERDEARSLAHCTTEDRDYWQKLATSNARAAEQELAEVRKERDEARQRHLHAEAELAKADERTKAALDERDELREKLAAAENVYLSGDACSPESKRIRDLEVTVCEQARIIASIRDTVSL